MESQSYAMQHVVSKFKFQWGFLHLPKTLWNDYVRDVSTIFFFYIVGVAVLIYLKISVTAIWDNVIWLSGWNFPGWVHVIHVFKYML